VNTTLKTCGAVRIIKVIGQRRGFLEEATPEMGFKELVTRSRRVGKTLHVGRIICVKELREGLLWHVQAPTVRLLWL
jgi:hypothetical protein